MSQRSRQQTPDNRHPESQTPSRSSSPAASNAAHLCSSHRSRTRDTCTCQATPPHMQMVRSIHTVEHSSQDSTGCCAVPVLLQSRYATPRPRTRRAVAGESRSRCTPRPHPGRAEGQGRTGSRHWQHGTSVARRETQLCGVDFPILRRRIFGQRRHLRRWHLLMVPWLRHGRCSRDVVREAPYDRGLTRKLFEFRVPGAMPGGPSFQGELREHD
jgi:hypothetical protein